MCGTYSVSPLRFATEYVILPLMKFSNMIDRPYGIDWLWKWKDGRYVTLHLMPLSFQEYYKGVASGGSPERAYRDYLAFTSFPHNRAWDAEPSLVADYLEGIVNTARSRLRDRRHERRGSFTIRPRPPSRSPSTRRSRPTAKMRKRPIVLDVTFRRFACKQDETVKKGDLT